MASAAVLSTLLLLLLRLKPSQMISRLSDFKVCGDPECARYLSRVTATLDYTGRDCRFLTFRHGDSIFVYFKLTGKRDDLWAGSIGKQFGYFPKDAVKVEDVMTCTEVELPTQESDFLCLDEKNNHIDNEEINSVINEYGENSFSMPEERKLEHELKPNKYNQVYEGNSAKTGPADNLIDLNKKLVQRTHAAKLEKNSDKDQLAKSLAHDENVQVNEFLLPAEHQNELSDESVSRQTDNEFDLVNLPDAVQSKYIGFEKDEHPGQEISEDNPLTMERSDIPKAVPEESNWIGSRISGWFGLGSNKDEKVVEPTDESMQLNSFISRKIPLDYDEKTVLSEEGNNNMYSEDRGVLGFGMSSWSESLSKLLNFNSDLPKDILSTNEGEKKHQNAKLYLDDSTDPSNTFVAESGNKISEHSVADDSRLKYSKSENIDTDEKNVMGHVESLFGLSDKLWFGQTNKAKNSDMTESTREENSNDDDKSESWWPNLNVVNDIFRLGGDNGDHAVRILEETQNAGGNEKNPGEAGESNSQWSLLSLNKALEFSQGNENQVPSLPDENEEAINENSKEITLDVDGSVSGRVTFGLKDILMFGQTDEDPFVSSPPEELKKSTFRDEKENTMNSESEEGSSMLTLVTSRVESIVDSIINEDAIQSPKQCLNAMENDVTCHTEYLQQSEKEYRETKNENTQSINGLKNNLESKLSKLEELLVQNVIQDSDFISHNKLLTQEHLHKDQSLQEHLIYISENDQHISDYTKTKNLHSGEKALGKQGDLQNQDLASEVEQITIKSEHDHSASESLSEEDKYLTIHSEWALNRDPGSETVIITAADDADHSAWDRLQVEGEILQDNNQYLLEEKLHHKQHISQQEDVIPALESEQFDVSGNNKLLFQIQSCNEQQNVNFEFNEIPPSSQIISSSQNELYDKEAFTPVTYLTSAKEQTSDHYSLLSEKDEKQEEMSQLSGDNKEVTANDISAPSLERELFDERWQVQSLQQVYYRTGDVTQEKRYKDKKSLERQTLTLDSESNQHTSVHRESLHEEKPIRKECHLSNSASYELASDADYSLSSKTHNEQNLEVKQASSNSEPQEPENQSVDLESTVDSSEEVITAPVISKTTAKSNQVHISLELESTIVLVNSLSPEDANPLVVHSGKYQDMDTKIKPQHAVQDSKYKISDSIAETDYASKEGSRVLSTESTSANLQKDETLSNSEKLIMIYDYKTKEPSKLNVQINASPEATAENINGIISTSKLETGAEDESLISKDAFSTDDNLDMGVASKEILEKTIQMSKHGHEQMETKDSVVTEKGELDLAVKITGSDNMAAETVVEHKLGNQLQKESWDLRNEEPGHHQTEEKTMSSLSSNDIKKPSATDDPKAETSTDNDIEYETSVQEAAGHTLGSIVDVNLQNFIIIVDNFIQNSYQTVMDTVSEGLGASTNLRGPRTELFLISFLLGIITALLFIYRTCQAVKSRRYTGREKQLAETVSQLFEEKCKVLETLSNCKQKYGEFEASAQEAAGLKQSTETKTLHLQDTYAKLDQSNDTLRQAIDQFTQDLEGEKQTRSQQNNLITEIRANLIVLENEAQNLKTQVEEAKKELKEIQVNDARHQESFQAAKEENYHLKESKEQLLQESEGWNERYSELTEHINLGVKSQKDIREVLACKDNEVKSLTDCLLKMKLWSVTEDNPAEGIPEEQQKQKIENLIYVAKLNASLKSVEEERNQIHGKLSDEINAKQELMERIEKLQLEHTSVQSVKSQFKTEYKTIQQKLKIMTELYHEKEMELQRNLTLEEHQRLQKEEKLSEVDGRINQATEELTIYRQRAKDLEEELMKTMQSYKNQIVSHEKKAHDNWLSAREAEREIGNIKRENIHFRQKITEAEFKMDIVLKDPLVIDVSGRPGLSASTFVPPYRGGSSPHGPSPVGRPGADPMGFLSPPLLDGPLRFSPLFPGKPDSKMRGPSVQLDHTANESTDSVSDRLSDQHGPRSDSGSLSPVWERDRKLFRTPPALICADGRPKQENSMQSSNSASESQAQDQDAINALLNPSLPMEAELGIRPGFGPAYLNQVPSLHVDLRGHVPLRGLPLPPRGGIYGPLERFPLRAFGLPPHPSLETRDPLRPGLYFPPPRPIFLPHRPFSNIAGGLLPSRLPLPHFPSTEHPSSSQDK
ncbi:cTAGE family member 5 isoform X1 [Rhinoraja longicauda]